MKGMRGLIDSAIDKGIERYWDKKVENKRIQDIEKANQNAIKKIDWPSFFPVYPNWLSKGEFNRRRKIYYESNEWKEFKKSKIEDAKYRCQVCYKKQPLDIHHLDYDKFGKEELKDVLAVCRQCHDVLEKEKA